MFNWAQLPLRFLLTLGLYDDERKLLPGAREAKVSIAALSLTGCVTLNILLDSAEPQFPHP